MTTLEQQAALRRTLQREGIEDRRVLDAIYATRRDLFVPTEYQDRAYHDNALPIGSRQTISQPYMVALMTQELGLRGEEIVLEIGTGSGYQAAVLAQLCRKVVTVERLRASLIDLYASVGADPETPQDVSRAFKLNASLTWNISKLIKASDGLSAVPHIPGSKSL